MALSLEQALTHCYVSCSYLPRQAESILAAGDFSERVLNRFFRRMQLNGETVTLLLDEFASLISTNTDEEQQAVRALLSLLRALITAVNPASPHLRPLALVTATRRPLDEVCRPLYGGNDVGSPFYNPFVTERLKPFARADVRELLEKRLEGTAVQFAGTEIAQLLATAGHHPILVQSYASELFNAKREHDGGIADFTAINRRFADRNRTHFHDFWLYSSQSEQRFLTGLIGDEIEWETLTPEQERARRQLRERGLLEADNRLFSPLFAEWLRLNQPQLAAQAAGGPDTTNLLRILTEYFNRDELRSLCLELGVNYDGLGGEGTHGKARELVDWMRRYGRLSELTDLLAQKRPHLNVKRAS